MPIEVLGGRAGCSWIGLDCCCGWRPREKACLVVSIPGPVGRLIEFRVVDDRHRVEADLRGDPAQQLVLRSEQAVDALCHEIEQLACREILLRAPVAADLRFLMSVLRVVPELERSHDLECYIEARATRVPGMGLPPRCRGLIERMGDLACDMWRRAADCWYQRDSSAVLALASADEEIDELHAAPVAESSGGTLNVITVPFARRLSTAC
jgi:hypothetical protein